MELYFIIYSIGAVLFFIGTVLIDGYNIEEYDIEKSFLNGLFWPLTVIHVSGQLIRLVIEKIKDKK